MRELAVRNAQRAHRIRNDQVREIARHLLDNLLQLGAYDLAVTFVSPRKMAAINQQFLQHEGSTDVITFDYGPGAGSPKKTKQLQGEIFISPEDAQKHARAFGTSWQEELIRYLVHGVLHLQGYDDLTPPERKIMKREEGRLLRQLGKYFSLGAVAG